ncbi:MAG: ABC transporter permease [Clostridia bacterium]|nr:ABC transporter permease [Clostridia bacterium]
MTITNLLISALSQGMIYAPMALGVFIAFRVLNMPDLTIDGSFVAGMCVCAVVTIAGQPALGLICGMAAGALAGLCTGLMQTRLRINPILSGILTMTGLYTVNFMVLGGQSNLYLQKTVVNSAGAETQVACDTLYKSFRAFLVDLTGNRRLDANLSAFALTGVIVAVLLAVLAVFFHMRTGMAIRATGDNEEMVRSSSINADRTRVIGIMISNALVALSGALLCQQQRYADLNFGSGMLVVGLASVIMGQVFFGLRSVTLGLISAAAGSLIYRLILQFAYKIDMPSYAVKLLSAVIVVIALTLPLLRRTIRERRAEREDAA